MTKISNSTLMAGVRIDAQTPAAQLASGGSRVRDDTTMSAAKVMAVPQSYLQFDPKKDAEKLAAAIDQLNKQMESSRRGLGFAVDSKLNLTVVTVRDTNTGEVVRQIPSDVAIRVAHHLSDLKGVLFSKDV